MERGTATDLGGLPGSRFNEASAINDAGQIIGVSLFGGTLESPCTAF
jgi:uncharacterized membrane protein